MAKLEIVGNNESVTFGDFWADYIRLAGGAGWGKAPVANFWVEGAAPGSRFRGYRATRRMLNIPLGVFGSNPMDIQNNMRQLVRILDGEAVLRYTQDDGRVFTIPIVYESGLEGDYELGRKGTVHELIVSCPDPYWTAQDRDSIEWRFSLGEPFLDRRVLSGASLSGDRLVNNHSDVPSRPRWEFHGPFTNLEVLVDGRGFEFTETLLVNEVLYVEHDGWSWRVFDDTGASRYAGIEFGPVFPDLPRGNSTVSLQLDGADNGTRVFMFWADRREVMF